MRPARHAPEEISMMYAMTVLMLLLGPFATLLLVLLLVELLQVPGYRSLPQGV